MFFANLTVLKEESAKIGEIKMKLKHVYDALLMSKRGKFGPKNLGK